MTRKKNLLVLLLIIGLLITVGYRNRQNSNQDNAEGNKPKEVRLGYFPNISHAQALVGVSRGDFQKILGDIKLETKTFNAGPAEIEALFAGEIDLGYIGPSPAINGYVKSNGEALRIISGSASGGASLVLQPDLADLYNKIGPSALIGKTIVSPQQGNTQDISLRHFLRENNLQEKVTIMALNNTEQLLAFKQKQIDGSWAPEPWATRLIVEGEGVRAIDERTRWSQGSFCITNVIVRKEFLDKYPEVVEKFLLAHNDVTRWVNENPNEAKGIVNEEIGKITGSQLSPDVLDKSWKMFDFTTDTLASSVFTFSDWAFDEGFLGESKPDLSGLYFKP